VVSTVGTRVGCLARMASMGWSSGCLSTPWSRNSQGTEGLVLRRGSDLLLDRERRQKGLNVCASHLLGMACVVEEHLPCDPGDRRVLRKKRIVLESDGIASVVEPLLGTWFRGLYRPEIMG
jgi:hypothetical protein